MQKETKGFKLIKLRTETLKELDKLKTDIEKKQPYLKGIISYNAIILMLLDEGKIKLTKNRYLILIKIRK